MRQKQQRYTPRFTGTLWTMRAINALMLAMMLFGLGCLACHASSTRKAAVNIDTTVVHYHAAQPELLLGLADNQQAMQQLIERLQAVRDDSMLVDNTSYQLVVCQDVDADSTANDTIGEMQVKDRLTNLLRHVWQHSDLLEARFDVQTFGNTYTVSFVRPETFVMPDSFYYNKVDDKKGITIAFKSNLLYDAALIPNIGVEIPLGNHLSIGLNWQYAWWQNWSHHRNWQTYGGDLELRYYLADEGARTLTGHHIGIYGQALTYDVEFGGKGWQSARWNYGGGISYGYSVSLGKHFNLDLGLGLGYLHGKFKQYYPMDEHKVWEKTKWLNFFGPTKAEVTLVWKIGGDKNRAEKRNHAENVMKTTETTETTMKGGAQ